MSESSLEALKKPPSGKKVQTPRAESETQTAVAVRVPSIKKTPATDVTTISEKLVTDEQKQNDSIARRRRMITKNRAQNIRTREKTPEASRTPFPHQDDTTTDEEEPKSPISPMEKEADDIYAEMKRKIREKNNEPDQDDINVEALKEAQAEEIKERRRRSISPFAVPSKEELERLQRKGSFIDPTNKLLTTVPTYALTPKDEIDYSSRRSSVSDEYSSRNSLNSPSSPSQFTQQPKFLYTPPPSPSKTKESSALMDKTNASLIKAQETQKPAVVVKQTVPQKKLKSSLKTPSNVSNTNAQKDVTKVENEPTPDAPPVRPKRSKSGTRSQGRTSESEMSEDQSNRKINKEPVQKAPKPKERRKTIAALKRDEVQQPPVAAKRSKSVTRAQDPKLDASDVEITKTSSEIVELLERYRKKSITNEENKDKELVSIASFAERTRQLTTPTRLASSMRKRRISCPKTIEVLNDAEVMQTFKEAQRRSVEIERSRHSSGYIDASQSEMTSSCYSGDSSSYSEDDYRFDLAKKTAELNRKLTLWKCEKDVEELEDVLKIDTKVEEKAKPKAEPIPKEPLLNNIKEVEMSTMKIMLKLCYPVWREFKVAQIDEYTRIKRLWNRCFSNIILIVLLCGLGGLVFRYTEGAFENFYKCGVRRVKRDFIDSLWQGSHNMREDDWKSMARKKLWEFETQLHTAHEAGVHSYSGQKAWSFMNSAVYCLTLITTIGYGHIAPSTTTGRAITIVYAIFGIPVFLILLADFGKLFTRCIKFGWAFVRRLYYTGSCRKVRRTVPVKEVMKGINKVYEAASTFRRPSQIAVEDQIDPEQPPKLPPKGNSLTIPDSINNTKPEFEEIVNETAPQTPAPSAFEIDDEFNLPISVAITVLVIYIFLGACVYVVWEEWSFFESFYFVFISMSTIGLGDLVPNHPMYMMGSMVYLVFGMALTSMCINVVQVKLSDSFRQASAKIGATIGLKVAEEDGSVAAITPAPIEIPAVHGNQKTTDEEENPKDK